MRVSGLSCGPHWGPGPQPRHVPWLGSEPVTLWFTAHAQSTELHQPGLHDFNVNPLLACKVVAWLTLCRMGSSHFLASCSALSLPRWVKYEQLLLCSAVTSLPPLPDALWERKQNSAQKVNTQLSSPSQITPADGMTERTFPSEHSYLDIGKQQWLLFQLFQEVLQVNQEPPERSVQHFVQHFGQRLRQILSLCSLSIWCVKDVWLSSLSPSSLWPLPDFWVLPIIW